MDNKDFLSLNTTTCIKGLAIMLVIIAHVGHIGFGFRLLVPLGCLGVSLFLILSGFGLMESYNRKGLKDFWKKRLLKVLLPYLLWIIPLSAYLLIVHKTTSPYDIRYWFVEYIFIWYIAFFFIHQYFPKYKWLLFGGIAILLFIIKPCLQAQQSFSFLIGMLISYYKERIINIKTKNLLIFGFICLVVGLAAFGIRQLVVIYENRISISGINDLIITQNVDNSNYLKKFIQLVTKAPIALFLLIVSVKIHIENYKWLYVIGVVSYELYIVHITFVLSIHNSIYFFLLFIIKCALFAYLLFYFNKILLRLLKISI